MSHMGGGFGPATSTIVRHVADGYHYATHVDTGRPTPAELFVSICGTPTQCDGFITRTDCVRTLMHARHNLLARVHVLRTLDLRQQDRIRTTGLHDTLDVLRHTIKYIGT